MPRTPYFAVILVAIFAFGIGSASAQSVDHPKYLRAYFLENEDGQYEQAARLYREVAADARLSSDVRADARLRADICEEEVVGKDLARLMRAETLVYAELHAPGEQLERLARQLGLLQSDTASQLGLSPILFKELLGIRGLAVSVTGFDPMRGAPAGLVVAHPGNIELLRGLLQSALPAAARQVEPVGGFPTYCIENEAYVTLTHRLIFASTSPASIAGGIQRLKGEVTSSLAASGNLAHALADRDSTLLTFGVNLARVMPMAAPFIAMGAKQNPEMAMLAPILDFQNWKSLTGRLGLGDDGAAFQTRFEMNDGHRNLAFNLLHMPPVDRATLSKVPAGVAALAAFSLNPRRKTPSQGSDHYPEGGSGDALPPVALFDLGRELFGNLVSTAVFVTDPVEPVGREMMPSVVMVVTANDASKTEAIWRQWLGVASVAARQGVGSILGEPIQIGGHASYRFPMPEGVELFMARVGQELMLGTNSTAIAKAISAANSGDSVLNDAVFAGPIGQLDPATTACAFIHPERVFRMVAPVLPAREVAQIEPFLEGYSKSVVSIETHHGRNYMGSKISLWSIPKIGPALFELLQARSEHAGARRPSASESRAVPQRKRF